MTDPALALLATPASISIGAASAWWLHHRSDLSPRNSYAGAVFTLASTAGAAVWGIETLLAPTLVAAIGAVTAAALGRRWRQSALGAGGELRQFELARRMAWRHRSSRVGVVTRIGSQGELEQRRGWPDSVVALPMTGDGRGRVPLGEGHHLLVVGATGSGKTTSARRWILARGLSAGQTSVLVLDPKGDPALEQDLRAIAARRGRPFVLFDPFDATTDRWNPVWADDPGAVVSRLVAPVEADSASDAAHYSRLLRVHLGLVAEALRAAGRWPVPMPLLLRCAHRSRFAAVADLASAAPQDEDLLERLTDHQAALSERSTQSQLDGSLRALEVVAGQSWRRVLSPDQDRGAIALPDAMAAGAVVLWRTHVEDNREEAETITTLALADISAAALTLPQHADWALLIDEFGSVLQGRAGERAVALMQRARSSHGQVVVCTQSVADIASATGNDQLLASLADNFTGYVLHRQIAPESRDWLAMLLGTRELWQSTDRTSSGRGDGAGSRRRAAEFRVRPDEFHALGRGEAVVWTTLGPDPEIVAVTMPPAIAGRGALAQSPYRPMQLRSITDVFETDIPDDTDPAGQAESAPDSPALGPRETVI